MNATLFHSPIELLHEHIPAESIDVILTDPPYPKIFLETWQELGAFAEHALKPSGHLLAMSGHAWMPQILDLLSQAKKIRYQWMLCLPMPSSGKKGNMTGTCIGRRVIRITWKPILWYVKPPSDVHQQLIDGIPAEQGIDKRYHDWGQNVSQFQWLLEKLKKGTDDIVCDPFVGGGTSAVAAVQQGCTFIGGDIDKTCIETTQSRLATLQLDFLSH